MGRRVLLAGAVIGLSIVSAGPAMAKTHQRTLVMSTRVQNISHAKASRVLAKTAASGDSIQYYGYRAECTAPNWPIPSTGNGQNFHSNDTLQFSDTSGELVSDCIGNLKHAYTLSGVPITYDHNAVNYAQVTVCRVFNPLGVNAPTIAGTGISVTYPNGLFTEICTATS
jgi:hypothetical protein